MTDVTFEIDDALLAQAAKVAEARGTTVAEMVLTFFSELGHSDQPPHP